MDPLIKSQLLYQLSYAPITLVRFVAGREATRVQARLKAFVAGRALDDDFTVLAELDNGGVATIADAHRLTTTDVAVLDGDVRISLRPQPVHHPVDHPGGQ